MSNSALWQKNSSSEPSTTKTKDMVTNQSMTWHKKKATESRDDKFESEGDFKDQPKQTMRRELVARQATQSIEKKVAKKTAAKPLPKTWIKVATKPIHKHVIP